jgi:hypothetical protein
MAYDYYRRRIVHPVYVMGLLGLCLVRMRIMLIDSDAWLGFSRWLAKFFLSVAFIAVLGLGHPATALASEPNLQPDKPNIWGIWIGTGGYADIDPRYRDMSWPKPQFTPWGAAESKRLATPESMHPCEPFGPVNYSSTFGNFPFEIARTTSGLMMTFEATSMPRRIYTDGRKHPDDLEPSWHGHSVGRWEGDTLVIDTVGTNGRGKPLNSYVSNGVQSKVETEARLPASEQLHLIERFRLVGDGRYLQNDLTIDDPKTYKQPFTVRRYWQRRPDLQVFEYYCEEDQR